MINTFEAVVVHCGPDVERRFSPFSACFWDRTSCKNSCRFIVQMGITLTWPFGIMIIDLKHVQGWIVRGYVLDKLGDQCLMVGLFTGPSSSLVYTGSHNFLGPVTFYV